jgi:small GTP-binding protein
MYDYSIRIILIGDCAVGKTAFSKKLMNDTFSSKYDATIGVDYSSKTIILNNTNVIKCQIWDTAGQESFAPLIKTYYRDVGGVILMYDVNDRKTYTDLTFWLNEIEKNKPEWIISKLLIANKIDSDNRVVSTEEGQQFAEENGFSFIEISVKKECDVSFALKDLVEDIYNQKDDNKGIKKSDFKKLALTEKLDDKYDRDCCCCS